MQGLSFRAMSGDIPPKYGLEYGTAPRFRILEFPLILVLKPLVNCSASILGHRLHMLWHLGTKSLAIFGKVPPTNHHSSGV